jgi:glycosyltransferase involved in cell wall biosynthesis
VAAPIRVLRVIARLNAGGPAHHVGVLSSRLDARGFETLLVHGSLPLGEPALAGFDRRYPSRRVSVATLGPEVQPLRDVRALGSLIRIARSFKPEIVHTHTAKAGMLGRVAAMTVRPRPLIVHTFHGHVLEGYFGALETATYRSIERSLASRSDCLIGVSHQTIAELVRLDIAPARKFRKIPLGLDLDDFVQSDPGAGRTVRRELRMEDGELLLVSIGRLVPIKRIDVALMAFARARRLGVRARLAIVGDGPLRATLEQRARELGVDDRVVFLGTRSDIVDLTAAADVMILTSDNEGTPVSLIEGAAAAKPAIATEAGGVPEVVAPGTGILVPAGDWMRFGDAIAELATSPDRRLSMGTAARRHVAARYRSSRLLEDVDDLYRTLLASR